jgi:hypothetical protein
MTIYDALYDLFICAWEHAGGDFLKSKFPKLICNGINLEHNTFDSLRVDDINHGCQDKEFSHTYQL